MSTSGFSQQGWRKARKRAVSSIIATILLVAITVVLAAVLYLLVSGLTSGGVGSKPIGSAFAASRPTAGTCAAGSAQTLGASAITGGCKAGDFIYTLTVESSSVSFGSVLFEVKTSLGATFTGGSASSSFAVIDLSNHVAAISITGAAMAMTAKWSGYGPTTTAPAYSDSTPITNQHLIVIDMGSATPTTNQGLAFVALGIGSYGGATNLLSLP
jgi:flagellin-like protein